MSVGSWIKVEDDIFFVNDLSVQFSTAAHASIDISVDLKAYPQYMTFFFNLFQSYQKVTLSTKDFQALGTIIKSIDYDLEVLHISFRCDLINISDKSERRDELIEELLNNKIKNNIN